MYGVFMAMRTFLYNKLVRDKMPHWMEFRGAVVHVKPLTDAEYDEQLRIKLLEEADEVVLAKSKAELMEEMADVYEVLDAFCAFHNFSKEEVAAVQEKKREERGGFFNRIFVTVTDHHKGSAGEQYCLNDPKKYPEVLEGDR